MIPVGRDALVKRIAAFVRGKSEESFGALALDVHDWQTTHSSVARALTTGPVQTWRDIPAVPVDLFKAVAVGTVPESQGVCFRTSGTTQGRRGAHRSWTTELYDLGAVQWARQCVPDLPDTTHALLVDPRVHPNSSLSHMTARLSTQVSWYLGVDGVAIEALEEALRAMDGPVFLPATAFALAEWLSDGEPMLPRGSVVMVTGGFKGRARSFDETTLLAEAVRRFRECQVVTEYGMTELSSQLWGTPGSPYRPPPWLHAYAVEPRTGAALSVGEVGQLRFVDLCNLDSAVAIETLDAGAVHPDGTVTLQGRLQGAAARGCSLTVEEAWQRGARA